MRALPGSTKRLDSKGLDLWLEASREPSIVESPQDTDAGRINRAGCDGPKLQGVALINLGSAELWSGGWLMRDATYRTQSHLGRSHADLGSSLFVGLTLDSLPCSNRSRSDVGATRTTGTVRGRARIVQRRRFPDSGLPLDDKR